MIAGRQSGATQHPHRPVAASILENRMADREAVRDDLRTGGNIKELTLRGIVLGALITVIFTAANVYLGLKIGITFATSIPAAVISMAVLKAFRDATIQENNIEIGRAHV